MTNSTSGTARFPRRRRPRPVRCRSRGTETTVVGKPVIRIDAYDRVSGSAQLPVRCQARRHAPCGGADVPACPRHGPKKVDTSAAEKMPGVRAILKDGDVGTNVPWFAGRGGFSSRLFDPHCRYEGDEVAVVAADTIYQAWDAVRAIKVDYEVLPQVTSVADALKPGAPAVRDGGNAIPPGKPYDARRRRGRLQVGRRGGRAHVHHAVRAAERDGAARVRREVGRAAPHHLGIDAGRVRRADRCRAGAEHPARQHPRHRALHGRRVRREAVRRQVLRDGAAARPEDRASRPPVPDAGSRCASAWATGRPTPSRSRPA